MACPVGDAELESLRVDIDRRVKLELHGGDIASDGDDPVMHAIVDRNGLDRMAASTNQMGRFETQWLTTDCNLAALSDLSGVWIDRVHDRRPPKLIILDMESSESPTYGNQEGSA